MKASLQSNIYTSFMTLYCVILVTENKKTIGIRSYCVNYWVCQMLIALLTSNKYLVYTTSLSRDLVVKELL